MLELYPDHCEAVKDVLRGKKTVDEQTFASLEVLNERLQRVRHLGARFSRVDFSPAVKQLKSRSHTVVVG
ncbi:MAG: hypothetical protein WAK60_05260 [Sedimentisphaerales bacterium]